MENNETLKEVFMIILAAIILALTVAFRDTTIFFYALVSFLIIITANILTKKIVGYYFETKIKIKFWSWYQFGFKKDMHFKKPVPMIWLPLILSLLTKGIFWWLAILEFDVAPKTERIARRHGLYRFTQVTEWHVGWIAIWGIIVNIFLAIMGYMFGFEFFAKLSVFYAMWSIIPLSSLDGTKILFSSRWLWTIFFLILIFFLGWGLMIV
ncbi:MAG: hypothetical protein ABIF88_00075 [archaeon]